MYSQYMIPVIYTPMIRGSCFILWRNGEVTCQNVQSELECQYWRSNPYVIGVQFNPYLSCDELKTFGDFENGPCEEGQCYRNDIGWCYDTGGTYCAGGTKMQCQNGKWVAIDTCFPFQSGGYQQQYCCVYWDGRSYPKECQTGGCSPWGPNNSVLWRSYKVTDCAQC